MKYTALIKLAAKTHYDKTPGHPKDQTINTSYFVPYFAEFGAGGVANDILRENYDRQRDDIVDEKQRLFDPAINKFNPDLYREQDAITDQLVALRRRRYEHLDKMSPAVDKANYLGIGLGALAGVGGAGLTYAGLGLIPAMKKKRVLRAIAALLAGLPVGYYTADRAAKGLFKDPAAQA